MNIEGKVAVITGGASGLGRATAEMIIANGGKVAILDLNEDLAKATANELGDARAYQVNVTDDESVGGNAEKGAMEVDELLEGTVAQEWGAVSNLDAFFSRLYQYYAEGGIICVLSSRVSSLM